MFITGVRYELSGKNSFERCIYALFRQPSVFVQRKDFLFLYRPVMKFHFKVLSVLAPLFFLSWFNCFSAACELTDCINRQVTFR